MSIFGFKGLLAPPCADDSGQALGIGLLAFHARGDLKRYDLELPLPYTGQPPSTVAQDLPDGWNEYISDIRDFDAATFVDDIQRQPVAWVHGAGELGPRALGHRSLLGDPRRVATKDFLNEVKGRQWWRPVAPIVLEEHAREWFCAERLSPFMLETFDVAPECRPFIPAALHLDGSARIQTLSSSADPDLHAAMIAFHAATGVPVLCNTSLNDRGEPIVECPAEALNFCIRKGVTVAYIDGRRYSLRPPATGAEIDGPAGRWLGSRYLDQERDPESVLRQWNLEDELLYLLFVWPKLHGLLRLPGGKARLRSIATLARNREAGFSDRARMFVTYQRERILMTSEVRRGENKYV
jgi:hypothetical protein